MARDLKLTIGGQSESAQKALEEAALASEAAAKAADHMANEFKKAERDAASLDKKLVETTVAARALAAEFAKTNDAGIKKQLDAQKKAASELRSLRSDIIGQTEKDAKAAAAFAKTAATALKDAEKAATNSVTQIGNLGKGFGELKEVFKNGGLIGGLGEALGPAAPFVGGAAAVPVLSAVGGAIGAGAGLGAVGLGAAGAVMGDPQAFQAAWGNATSAVKADLADAAKPFEGPLLDAIASVGPLVASWHLGDTLSHAAGYVKPLVDGLSRFASGIEHGFAALADHAGPEVAAVAQGFVKLGNAADDALTNISRGSEGGAQALTAMFNVLANGVEAFGAVTLAAEDTFSFIHDHPIEAAIATGGLSLVASGLENVATTSDKTTSKLTEMKSAGDQASSGLSDVAAAAKDASDRLDRLNQLFDDSISKSLGLKNANIDVAQGLADIAEKFQKGKNALDINTQAGRDNQQLILSQISALEQQRQAAIALGDGTEAATKKADDAYNNNLAKLDAMLTKLLGSKKAAEDFLDTFKNKDFTITGHVNIQVVESDPNGLLKGGAPHRLNSEIAFAHGGIRRAAGGMIVPPRNPGTVLMGEPSTGGEALIPLGNSISDSSAMALAGAVGRAHGFAVSSYGSARPSSSSGPLQLVYTGTPGGLEAMHLSWLAEASRTGRLQIRASSVMG